jgi:ribosomal protein S21
VFQVVEFKRKKGESFEGFLRRFNKTLIRSRKLNEVRKRKYLQPKKNKSQQKEYALVSNKLRSKKEYLRKIGKLKEETRGRW